MKQFQVPQFIDVEDKILGPITMRHFFIMLIPMGTGILLYFLLKFWLVVIILIPVTIGSAIFAFFRPYGVRFLRFFRAFLAFFIRPPLYIFSLYGLSVGGLGFWVLDVVNLLMMLLIRGSSAKDVFACCLSFGVVASSFRNS